MPRTTERHRKSIRAPGFDYRDPGTYFVTMCTNNREHLFGEIRNGIMGLNEYGCVVADEIRNTTVIRPYVHIDTWIIMPNHVHILFRIDDHIPDVIRASPRDAPTFQLPAQSLGSIINHFKSACTKRINTIHDFDGTIWQRNYHDHIVRSIEECDRIRIYIRQNPANWISDEYHIPTT